MTGFIGLGDRDFYCKKCGYAVCKGCSNNKRYLSKDSKEKFRVCDNCDAELDNNKLKSNYEQYILLKQEKIQKTKELLEKLKE